MTDPASKYGTIVADPPWAYPEGFALGPGHGTLEARPLPYPSMPFEDICALPVRDLAEKDCLVWHKTDANLPASVAPNSAEFVLVATRGAPGRLSMLPSSVIATTRSGGHSAKPEVWLDYFEAVSPGPHLELFARRQRLGWDTWGNEALSHVELGDLGGAA